MKYGKDMIISTDHIVRVKLCPLTQENYDVADFIVGRLRLIGLMGQSSTLWGFAAFMLFSIVSLYLAMVFRLCKTKEVHMEKAQPKATRFDVYGNVCIGMGASGVAGALSI